ncbi:helix-turn-helix transcriptional regulator [Streptomyces sp. NPDC001691]|uniref:helix-turn-helix transcriptional regulator n=1 Tax=Streptomyces sp. NPDC001691 TaxID=3364600 RepID=UPI0036B87A2A
MKHGPALLTAQAMHRAEHADGLIHDRVRDQGTEPISTDRRDAHPAALRRALDHIDDHADQPVTVAEIAAAAHVTVRALQYAFRRHLDTTPLAHLRRVRLSHAHQALLDADPGKGHTVTEIAARWGFYHPGRFATIYRDCYGRSPHHTLHRS